MKNHYWEKFNALYELSKHGRSTFCMQNKLDIMVFLQSDANVIIKFNEVNSEINRSVYDLIIAFENGTINKDEYQKCLLEDIIAGNHWNEKNRDIIKGTPNKETGTTIDYKYKDFQKHLCHRGKLPANCGWMYKVIAAVFEISEKLLHEENLEKFYEAVDPEGLLLQKPMARTLLASFFARIATDEILVELIPEKFTAEPDLRERYNKVSEQVKMQFWINQKVNLFVRPKFGGNFLILREGPYGTVSVLYPRDNFQTRTSDNISWVVESAPPLPPHLQAPSPEGIHGLFLFSFSEEVNISTSPVVSQFSTPKEVETGDKNLDEIKVWLNEIGRENYDLSYILYATYPGSKSYERV